MTVFVTAMACEAEAVTRLLDGIVRRKMFGRPVSTGRFGDREVAVIEAGVGKVNAAAGAQMALAAFGVGTVCNVGVAGGLDAAMVPFATYTVKAAVQYDFDLAQLNRTAPGVLNEYVTPFLPLEPVPGFPAAVCVTGDRFSDDDDSAVPALVRDFGAGLRDMELGAIAHVCARAGARCVALKTVTDVHGRETAMTVQYRENLARGIDELSASVATLLQQPTPTPES